LPVSGRTLNIMAAAVWFVGGVVLLLKGGRLLAVSAALKSPTIWPWVAGLGGLCLGGIKAKLLFAPSCRRNLRRIAALENPRIWQFFRPAFVLFLLLMILLGATASRFAHGSYPAMLAVGFVDISIATALLGSSPVFWKEDAFAESAAKDRRR